MTRNLPNETYAMAGLDPATHAVGRVTSSVPGLACVRHILSQRRANRVGSRVKPGHDGLLWNSAL